MVPIALVQGEEEAARDALLAIREAQPMGVNPDRDRAQRKDAASAIQRHWKRRGAARVIQRHWRGQRPTPWERPPLPRVYHW